MLSHAKLSHCRTASCPGKICPGKNIAGAWSPAVYEPGTTRANRNVLEITALGIDIDHASDADIAEAAKRLEPYAYFAHSTHNDRPASNPAERALRVVVQLSEPVKAADWKRFWLAAVELLGLPADRVCKEPARLYYLPTHRADAEFFFTENAGRPLDVAAILASAPPEAPSSPATPLKGPGGDSGRGPASPAVLQAARERLARHGPAIQGQGGDAHTFQVGAILFRGFDLTPDEAIPLALEWNRTCQPPWAEGELLLKLQNGQSYAQGEPGSERALVEAKEVIASLAPRPFAGSAVGGVLLKAAVSLEEALLAEKPPVRYIPTGMRGLDERLGGGMATRNVLLLSGPPGAGKTGFAVKLARCFARPLYVTTELESDEMAFRFAAEVMGEAWTDLERGTVPRSQVIAAVRASGARIIGAERLPRAPKEACRVIIEAAIEMQADGLVVDFLQDMITGTEENQRGHVGELGEDLKAVCVALDIPGIFVSSVARTWYTSAVIEKLHKDGDARAYLTAAKESGDLDYIANAMLFLDVWEHDVDVARARIAVAKSRRGRPGFVGARFHGAIGSWEYAPEVMGELEAARGSGGELGGGGKDDADDAKVLGVVGHFAATGQAFTKNQLRDMCSPLSKHRADAAILRLLSSGRLVHGNGVERIQTAAGHWQVRAKDRLYLPTKGDTQ